MNQDFELLVLKETFQKAVKDFRKTWKIPLRGFKDKEAWGKWEDQLIKEDEESYKAQKCPPGYLFRIKALNKESKDFFKNFNITPRYFRHIKNYLFLNDFTPDFWAEFESRAQKIKIHYKSENEAHPLSKDRLFVEIFADTTRKEYLNAWKNISRQKKKLLGFSGRNTKKSFEKNKRIYELRKQGLKLKEVAKVIKDEFGVSVDYQNVPNFSKGIEKKIGRK